VRTVVLDTNVLLTRPEVLTAFSDAEVLLPDTVLTEIDKLKTARVDADLRFRGREVSRALFELSESGSLQDGVDLPGGGRLRVVTLLDEHTLPEGLSSRSADDRILGIALQAIAEGADPLTLVTNDLNMLLKAQTYGVEVERSQDGESFSKRYFIRPFQRYRGPITILAVAVAVFAAIVYLVAFSPFALSRGATGIAALPQEFVDQLPLEQQQVLTYLFRLQNDPKDIDTQRTVAILYDQMAVQNIAYLPYAIKHYEALLQLAPNDTDSRTDLATAYFKAGRSDTAIQEVNSVLRIDPNHINANFNLGVFYMSAKPPEFQKAANQFQKVIRLTQDSPRLTEPLGRARTMLDQVMKDAAAAGVRITADGGTL
jgi:tetratricopeptide (TPR) repeat protein